MRVQHVGADALGGVRQGALDPADIGISPQKIVAILLARLPRFAQRHLHQGKIARSLAHVAQHLHRQRFAIGRVDAGKAKGFGDDPAQAFVAHTHEQKADAALIGFETFLQTIESAAQVDVVMPHGEHDTETGIRRIGEIEQQVDEGGAHLGWRDRQQLLELIDDEQHPHPLGRQIVAQGPADPVRLSTRGPIGEGAAVRRRESKTLGGFVNGVTKLAKRLVARPGGERVPDGILRP